MADITKETPWNSISKISEGIFQDSEIIIKSGNANYRMPGYQFAQAFGGLGITEGTCSTAADTAIKKCSLSNYNLEVLPKVFNITFTNENSYGDTEDTPATYPTLEIYNSNNKLLGSYPVGDSRGHYAGSGCWDAGDTMRFCLANGKFCIQNSDVRQKNSTNSDGYTIYSDGSAMYNKQSVDNQINGALANYPEIVMSKYGTALTEVDLTNLSNGVYFVSANNLYGNSKNVTTGILIKYNTVLIFQTITSENSYNLIVNGNSLKPSTGYIYGLKIIKIGYN